MVIQHIWREVSSPIHGSGCFENVHRAKPGNLEASNIIRQDMRNRMDPAWRVVAAVCLAASAAVCARAQVDAELTAKRRLFPEIGPGFKTIKRGVDGKIYVLASPSPGLVVFSGEGKRLLSMREAQGLSADAKKEAMESGEVLVGFGEDFDIDGSGNLYVADPANNVVQVFAGTGKHLLTIPVTEPVSVATLPEGEVAVSTLREPELVNVYDKNGREVRDFGDPDQLTDRADLNRFLNIGKLANDALGHLYYAFEYAPEPTVRQYDRFGYAGEDIVYQELDALGEARAVRREIARQEKKGDAPRFKRVLTAVGVERDTGEVWMAMGDTLLHFDKEGDRRATYLLYTPEGARLEAVSMVVEKDKLLIGGDPIGIYEFELPQD